MLNNKRKCVIHEISLHKAQRNRNSNDSENQTVTCMPPFFKFTLYNEINLSVRFQDYL